MTITRLTRQFGSSIWFFVTMNAAGTVTNLEEHDWHEGGRITADKGKSLEQTFLDHASSRIHPSDETLAEAQAFLADMRSSL